MNYENHVLSSSSVKVGETPAYDGIPERPSDERYSYTFTGWDNELVPVTEVAEYKAQFTRVPIVHLVECTEDAALVLSPEAGEYTVVFAAYNDDDTLAGIEIIPVQFEEAGEKIVKPEKKELLNSGRVKVMLWDNLSSMMPKCEYDEKISLHTSIEQYIMLKALLCIYIAEPLM